MVTLGVPPPALDPVLFSDYGRDLRLINKEQPMDNEDGYFDEKAAARYDEQSAESTPIDVLGASM